MKKWLWCLVAVPVALVLVSPAPAREGRMRKGFKFWKSEKVVKKLDLSDEQIAELSEIDYQNQKAKIEINARLESAQLELEHLLSGDTVSEAETSALVDRIADARRDQVKLGLERQIKVRSILSAEQWKKLEDLKKNFARKMKGKRSGREGSRWVGGREHGKHSSSDEEDSCRGGGREHGKHGSSGEES